MSNSPDVVGALGSGMNAEAPALTPDELRLAYRIATRSRAVEEHIVRLVSRGEVKFAIFGPGEEIHGTAAALAMR